MDLLSSWLSLVVAFHRDPTSPVRREQLIDLLLCREEEGQDHLANAWVAMVMGLGLLKE